jgi:hypothetical protein
MITPQVDRHIKVPKDKVTFLEFDGLVLDTGIILEDKLEVGLRTSLDKIDRYFYETISCLLRNVICTIYLSNEHNCT